MATLIRMAGLGLLTVHLLGCIPLIPFYRDDDLCSTLLAGEGGDPMRQNVEKAADGFPVIGTSTREEVLLKLGEPDDWSETGRTFTYRWRMVLYRYPPCGCSTWRDHRRTYLLRVVFDEDGIVRQAEFD